MMALDLFEEFGKIAGEYGWRGVGQPEPYRRRYGKGDVTVLVQSNRAGTAIAFASRRRPASGGTTVDSVDSRDRGKRDTVLDWLRAS